MQTAKDYSKDVFNNIEHALSRMPLPVLVPKTLPINALEITCHVDQLLSPDEMRVCDMATD